MKEIALTNGGVCLVDDEDFERLAIHGWGKMRSGQNWYACLNGKVRPSMHRVILGITDRRTWVDHVNGNTLDNRRSNLRIASFRQNRHNSRKHGIEKTSSTLKGAYRTTGGAWGASIGDGYGKKYLGSYPTEELAGKAYDLAARVEFGAFARINFPEFTQYQELLDALGPRTRIARVLIEDYMGRLETAVAV